MPTASHILFVVAALLIILAAYVKFRQKYQSSSAPGGLSAFAKIADADVKQKEAEGKIIAIKAAASGKQAAADSLKKAALEAHNEIDKAHQAFDDVHHILGN
jgi:hypothetical protein